MYTCLKVASDICMEKRTILWRRHRFLVVILVATLSTTYKCGGRRHKSSMQNGGDIDPTRWRYTSIGRHISWAPSNSWLKYLFPSQEEKLLENALQQIIWPYYRFEMTTWLILITKCIWLLAVKDPLFFLQFFSDIENHSLFLEKKRVV